MKSYVSIGKRRLRVPTGGEAAGANDELHPEIVVLDHVSSDETAVSIRNNVEPSLLRRVWIFVDLEANRFARLPTATGNIRGLTRRIVQLVRRNAGGRARQH